MQDVFRIRVRYRFYMQTEADDCSDQFLVPVGQRPADPLEPGTDRTQDSDLSEFTSHTLGLKLTLHATDSVVLDLGGDYVIREDGINQLLFSVGLRVGF